MHLSTSFLYAIYNCCREDGYLCGVDNMIDLFENILKSLTEANTPTRPTDTLPTVDIIVTAPSPTSARKQTLRRQVAQTLSGENSARTTSSEEVEIP